MTPLKIGSTLLLCFFVVTLVWADANSSSTEDKVDKVKNRLETLFIWRVTDRLGLTPNEELSFSKIYKEVVEDRQQYAQKLEKILDQIEQTKADKDYERLVKDYTEALKKYNECQTRELDQLRRVFDSKRMGQYMLVKRDMTRRFKDVLSTGTLQGQSTTRQLKEPEVIQEK